MNDSYRISSVPRVISCSEELINDANYYSNLVSQLEDAKAKLSSNWEGDAADIQSIIAKIGKVSASFSQLIPLMQRMGKELISFANESQRISDRTVR